MLLEYTIVGLELFNVLEPFPYWVESIEEELFEYDLSFEDITAKGIIIVDWDKSGDLMAIASLEDKEQFGMSEKRPGNRLGFH